MKRYGLFYGDRLLQTTFFRKTAIKRQREATRLLARVPLEGRTNYNYEAGRLAVQRLT